MLRNYQNTDCSFKKYCAIYYNFRHAFFHISICAYYARVMSTRLCRSKVYCAFYFYLSSICKM